MLVGTWAPCKMNIPSRKKKMTGSTVMDLSPWMMSLGTEDTFILCFLGHPQVSRPLDLSLWRASVSVSWKVCWKTGQVRHCCDKDMNNFRNLTAVELWAWKLSNEVRWRSIHRPQQKQYLKNYLFRVSSIVNFDNVICSRLLIKTFDLSFRQVSLFLRLYGFY